MKLITGLTLALLALPALATPIDGAQSHLTFTMKQMNVPVSGQFKKVTGDVIFDLKTPAKSRAEINVAVSSISLPTADATAQTQKAEWFNTARYPNAHFVTDSIKPLGADRYQFSGRLTLKGITRPISAPFSARTIGQQTVIDGVVPISRLAFKVGEGDWADTDTVADSVALTFHIVVPKRP